jgi:hypothetical protein
MEVTTHPVSATTLAWLAEGAHGRQGTKLYLVEEANGELVLTDEDPRPAREPILEVVTTGERSPLKPAHKIAIQVNAAGPETDLLRDPKFAGCDSLFWTASSIEKFLIPYYHAQRLYSQSEISRLMELYRADAELVAAAHVAPSKPRRIGAVDTGGFLRAAKDGLEWVGFTEYLR